MKLAIFLQAPEIWGAETSLLTLLATEAAAHHDIEVYISPDSPLSHELTRLGIDWHTFNFVRHKSLAKGGLRKASLFAICSDILSIAKQAISARAIVSHYDAVVTFGLWETAEIAIAGRLSQTPVIFDFHVTFSGRMGRAALKCIASLARGVIAPSSATYAQAGITQNSKRLRVVPRPVTSLAPATPAVSGNRKLRVGIFGQVDDRKGVLEAITTLAPMAELVTFVVVGAHPEHARTAYENDICELVRQVGRDWEVLERTDRVGELMAQCDVVLNMSRHEAFGRTVVEAAGAGAFPIVMAGGGPEEVVNNMGHGLVVSSWNELSDAVESLSSTFQSGRSVRLDANQVESTLARYSPSAIGKQYFDEIENLSGTLTRIS